MILKKTKCQTGRSMRLKQVCARGSELVLPSFSMQKRCGPLLPVHENGNLCTCARKRTEVKRRLVAHRTDELREAAEWEAAGAGGELQEAQALVVLQFGHQAPEPLHLLAVLRVAPVDRVPPPVLHVDRHRLHPRQQHLRAANEALRALCEAQQTPTDSLLSTCVFTARLYTRTRIPRARARRTRAATRAAPLP